MKLRHAAALALVGWYLMAPPLYEGHKSNLDAPLSEWVILDSFDSANDCWRERSIMNTDHKRDFKHDSIQRERLGSISCIATDDPRLKGN